MAERPGVVSRPAGVLLALGAGVVWALCFARSPLVLAPWLALVPLFLVLARARRPFAAGALFGLAYWLTSIPWIQPTMRTYGGLSAGLATLALVLACAYLGLYSAAFAALAARMRRHSPALAIAGPAGLWVALENLRGGGPLAFPWNLAAYAVVETPGALAVTAWIGAWGLSFLVVAVNAAVALGIERRSWRPAVAVVVVTVGLLALAAWASPGVSSPPEDGTATVRLLQPDRPVDNEWDEERVRAEYRELLAQSRAACDAGPGLLVWPESATWPFSWERHAGLRRDVGELARRGCPVLLNSAVREGDRTFNSVYLISDGEDLQRYDKEILVPFGETVPFGRWIPGLRTVARAAGGFSPGAGDRLLVWGGERLGISICFEIVFPAKAVRQTRRGATALVTVTNDAWYGDSWAPYQHFRAARFRAAENRRPVLRAAITGISGVIAADGSVRSHLGVGEQGTLEATLAADATASSTVFTHTPWLVPTLAWLLAGFAIFSSSARRRER